MDILQTNQHRKQLQKNIGLDYWSKLILWLYILTMPFVSAFAFTGTISLPLIFALLLFFLMILNIIRSGKFPNGFLGFDIVIIFLLLFLDVFSFMVNGLGVSKSLNHTIAYLSTCLLFYISIKFTLFNIQNKNLLFKRILQFIAYTTLLSAIYSNIEFISSNIFGVNLNDYVPRPSEEDKSYSPVVLSLFYRSRGFAYESGVYTQMMEAFAPITIYYLYFSGYCGWAKWIKILSTVSIFLGIVFAASSATFVTLPIAIIFSSLFFIKKIIHFFSSRSLSYYLRLFISVLIILIVNSYLSIYTNVLLSVTEKLDSYSLDDRQSRMDFFFDEFSKFNPLNKIIGAGPAGTDILGFDGTHVIISLYYNVTFELGFIGIFFLMCLFGYIFFNTISIKSKIGFFLTISVVSSMMHYYVVHDFWVPWFWFISVFSIFFKKSFDGKFGYR